MNGILAAGYFLFSLMFSLVTFVLWVRIALRYFRVSSLNPVSQVVYRLTDSVVLPVAKALRIPNTRQNRYDWPCFIVLVATEIIKFLLVGWLFFTGIFPWFLLILYPIADMIVQPLGLLFYAVLIRAIMSWVNPTWRNPFSDLLIVVTEPMLSIIRRYLPFVAGIDFSPFVLLIVIKVITLFISASMPFHLV
ncbi:MAG: YggT family protein [Legionellaceae bacterium]|nr:YggT family protein [Legionellaceae bacterium]